jgi:hypothetical protein
MKKTGNWTEPKTIPDWTQRVLAMRPILLCLLVMGAIILEMRFDWVERAVAAYLVTTNDVRPESGAIWEKGHRSQTARQDLEQIIANRQTFQREARSADTFSEIAGSLPADQGAMLSAERFRQLYLKLPREESRKIIPALELLGLSGQGSWRRTYLEKNGDTLIAYLLDGDNRVLRSFDVPATALLRMDVQGEVEAQTLDDLPSFKNRIYPAARFFETLAAFPEDLRRNVILNPEVLLKPSGQIVRIGISDEAVSGYIQLGVEYLTGTRRQVVLTAGHEWAVWRLRSSIEGKGQAAASVDIYKEDHLPR